jgi:hypothetical protein
MQRLRNKQRNNIRCREWLSKHVPVAMDMHVTIEVVLEMVFSMWSVQSGYITRTPAWEVSYQLKVRL